MRGMRNETERFGEIMRQLEGGGGEEESPDETKITHPKIIFSIWFLLYAFHIFQHHNSQNLPEQLKQEKNLFHFSYAHPAALFISARVYNFPLAEQLFIIHNFFRFQFGLLTFSSLFNAIIAIYTDSSMRCIFAYLRDIWIRKSYLHFWRL